MSSFLPVHNSTDFISSFGAFATQRMIGNHLFGLSDIHARRIVGHQNDTHQQSENAHVCDTNIRKHTGVTTPNALESVIGKDSV